MSLRVCSPALALALSLACGRSGEQAAPGSSAQPASSARSPSSSSSGPTPPAALLPATLPAEGCRVLSLVGDAKRGEATLTDGALLDGAEWVTLMKAAKLTLKHVTSGRELQIEGPAFFRACQRGREQVLLAQGRITTTAGTGARPGAEVLLATPVAAVRYADAELDLEVDARSLRLAVRVGRAEIDPFPPPSSAIASLLGPKQKLTLPLGKPDPHELIAGCRAAAEHAANSARSVAEPSASEPLGERAKRHVQARQAARASCTVAATATGLVADPNARAGLWAEAAKWEGLWETIPRRPRAKPAEK